MPNSELLIGGLMIFFIVLVGFARRRGHEIHVKELLTARGYQNITVQTRLLGGGRNTQVLDVTYQTASGETIHNSCMLNTNLFADGKLYWEKPLD